MKRHRIKEIFQKILNCNEINNNNDQIFLQNNIKLVGTLAE